MQSAFRSIVITLVYAINYQRSVAGGSLGIYIDVKPSARLDELIELCSFDPASCSG